MKWFKRGIISILIVFFFLVAFYKPNRINLDGTWDANEVVLDGKKIYPDVLTSFIDFPPKIVINGWTKSILIPIQTNKISARLQYTETGKGRYKIKLSSKERSLNGDFDLLVDTTDIGPQAYIVDVKIKSINTLIHFQRRVIIPPWKPEFPKRGQV